MEHFAGKQKHKYILRLKKISQESKGQWIGVLEDEKPLSSFFSPLFREAMMVKYTMYISSSDLRKGRNQVATSKAQCS